ncbi:MAG: prephenate dehydrogenase [Ruminococcus sp.]|nr:prephenate dehydrogenase [Ruminococcus sp.]
MKIAVIGLGIIGGSYCKAIKAHTDHYVIGINRSVDTARQALADGAIDEIGCRESLGEADLIILCLYPQACVDYITENGAAIKKGAIVTDACGIKRAVCPQLQALSKAFGFVYVGSHPMAGKEKNGYAVSEATLFEGASFIITPCGADEQSVAKLEEFARSIGFGSITLSDPEEHDRMIAYTSQLPHILACAYVLSPCCPHHKGFSAGSYRDVSRVANINAKLWSELFLENQTPLVHELDVLIDNISHLIEAIEEGDRERLEALLEQGHQVKQMLGE